MNGVIMKITLFFSPEESAFLVTSRVILPRIAKPLTFIVDTGSPKSFIGAIDAKKWEIPFTTKRPEIIYWGDKEFKLQLLRNVQLWLVGEEDGQEKIKYMKKPSPKLYVTHDYVHEEKGDISPNVLGIDFLFNNGFRLVIDGKSRTAWLED